MTGRAANGNRDPTGAGRLATGAGLRVTGAGRPRRSVATTPVRPDGPGSALVPLVGPAEGARRHSGVAAEELAEVGGFEEPQAAGDGRHYVSDPEFDDYAGRRGYGGRSGYGGSRWAGRGASGSRSSAGGPSSSASAAPARAKTNPLIGMRVRHPKYGVGTVLSVEGDDEDRRLTISFSDFGTKKLVERYANLRRE